MMKMTNKIKLFGIVFGLFLLMVVFQACDVQKAVVETMQQLHFKNSAHADKTAEAFVHWDGDTPPVVPTSCAKCHTLNGFIEFATTGAIAASVTPGVFNCTLCHTNAESGELRAFANGVTFPSGAVVKNLGPEAVCMQCHQGRTSVNTVNTAITNAGVGDDVSTTKLSFSNIHYLGAAVALYGTVVKGGYEYTGNTYDAKFAHITGYGACTDCHDSHSLEVKYENCKTCHPYVQKYADLKNIRWVGSEVDYDGDGNITEGMYYEVNGVKEILYTAIISYAKNITKVAIGYNPDANPYWFKDLNSDGVIDASEAVSTNRYNAFSPRLLKACYNYQVAKKDPGCFAHGGKYIIELLYDSLADLNSKLPTPLDISALNRSDEGHFDGSSMAWRDWDAEGAVPANCSRCHSSTGLAYYLANGKNDVTQPITNGMLCTTCHTSPPALRRANEVAFPSGVKASLEDSSNLCMLCHQGRAWKGTVDANIASKAGDYSFNNPHYFPAAAIYMGAVAHGGYEYTGKSYAGKSTFPNHMGKFVTCVQCHFGSEGVKGHNVADPKAENCVDCHGQDISQPVPGADPATFSFEHIRPASIPDFDGDGDVTESLKDEILSLEATLYAQLQAYCKGLGKPVIYDTNAYPYWFKDTNGNGVVDAGENVSANGYKFDAKSLKGAYNYQVSHKEPHGFIHNAWYVSQLLVDSIVDLGGNAANYPWR